MDLDKEAVRALLPSVGDELLCTPAITDYTGRDAPVPTPCVVVYVNSEHLWYRVRYDNGKYECFKLPELGQRGGQGLRYK